MSTIQDNVQIDAVTPSDEQREAAWDAMRCTRWVIDNNPDWLVVQIGDLAFVPMLWMGDHFEIYYDGRYGIVHAFTTIEAAGQMFLLKEERSPRAGEAL